MEGLGQGTVKDHVPLGVKMMPAPRSAGDPKGWEWSGWGRGPAAGAGHIVVSSLVEAEGVGGIEAVLNRKVDEGGADGPVAEVCSGLDCRC